MHESCYSVVRFARLAFIPSNIPLDHWSLSHLTIEIFSRRRFACPFGNLWIAGELECISFGAGAYFLVSNVSDHSDVKLTWRVDSDTAVPTVSSSWQAWSLVVLGLFLNILTNFLSSEGDRSDPWNFLKPFWWLEKNVSLKYILIRGMCSTTFTRTIYSSESKLLNKMYFHWTENWKTKRCWWA